MAPDTIGTMERESGTESEAGAWSTGPAWIGAPTGPGDTGTATESGIRPMPDDTDLETGAGAGIGPVPDEVALDPISGGPADVDSVEALLDEVDLALARLDDGSYGRCESCGTIIADDRLAEIPTARTCAACPPTTA